jgi:hypothetical protein
MGEEANKNDLHTAKEGEEESTPGGWVGYSGWIRVRQRIN